MKKIALVLAMTAITSIMSFAQLEEGFISYEIEVSSDNPDMAMAVTMFAGSKMDLYFDDNKARTELNMGTYMNMSTVVDNETKEVLLLMGGMMGNKAVLTNTDEMGAKDTAEEEIEDPKITLTSEEKEIAGYNCKKAIIADEEGNEVEYWYTEDIKPVSTDEKSTISKLPGLALQYSLDNGEMIMTFTASKIEDSLDKKTKKEKFSFEIPSGYEEMTFEQFSKIGGI